MTSMGQKRKDTQRAHAKRDGQGDGIRRSALSAVGRRWVDEGTGRDLTRQEALDHLRGCPEPAA